MTHFVENPYIRSRERASQRQRDGKVRLGEAQLLGPADEQDADMTETLRNTDIYIQQESGKMIVTDVEELEKEREARRAKRQREGYGVDSDTDSDDDGGSGLM